MLVDPDGEEAENGVAASEFPEDEELGYIVADDDKQSDGGQLGDSYERSSSYARPVISL